MDQGSGRRRIDRVTAPGLRDKIAEADPAWLRATRDDCRAEEARLSFERRLLQARIDLTRAEVERREAGAAPMPDDDAALVARLSAVLADHPSTERHDVVHTEVYEPPADDRREGADVGGAEMSRLRDLDDETLQEVLNQLVESEQRTSSTRRTVLDNLDALQAELVRRLRDGEVALDDLVAADASTDDPPSS